MVSAAFKNRTRDEIIAAFRESIRKKHEWQERAEQEIKKILDTCAIYRDDFIEEWHKRFD